MSQTSPEIERASDFWMAERGMMVRLEAQAPNGEWIAIFPSQLDQMIKHGLPVRATEVGDHAQCQDQWRCFHCNEVFTDAKAAANHFGVDHLEDETLCQMAQVDGGIARVIADLSEELQRYRSEDNESFREFYRLGADHRQALIREEQKGYDRGLADGRTISDTSTDRTSK